DAERITDKMPLNYRQLGLIHSVFPEARVVHIRRNPIDTCLSIYTTYLGDETNYAYNKENIVAFYLDYMRLMEHWRAILPADRFCELNYEDIVSDRAGIVGPLLEFCGLRWDDACL